MNLVEYADHTIPGLFPVQRFVLKMLAGLPLDQSSKTIRVTDKFNDKVLYNLSEADYLSYLHKEGRASIGTQWGLSSVLVGAFGRRSGKTVLHGLAAAHAAHRLLSMDNPHAQYGLPDRTSIKIGVVSPNKDQAAMVSTESAHHIERDEMSKRAIQSMMPGKLRLRSGKGFVDIFCKSAVAKGLRGHALFHIGLDETAFFQDQGSVVYNAMMPSRGAFQSRDAAVRRCDATTLVTSTPHGTGGFFHTLYKSWFHPELKDYGVSLRIPTWEMNPTLPSEFLRSEYKRDPRRFAVEYGAEFVNEADGVDVEG